MKINLDKENKILNIKWDDNTESRIKLSVLRKNCPCADCTTEKLHRPANYIPVLSSVSMTIKDIKPVGAYAIQIYWQDRHETGIYPFELLKKLET